jgi:hypothetical protein
MIDALSSQTFVEQGDVWLPDGKSRRGNRGRGGPGPAWRRNSAKTTTANRSYGIQYNWNQFARTEKEIG